MRDRAAIEARLDAVGFLLDQAVLREDLRAACAGPDARALARLAFARGGPRDLAAIRDGLAAAETCARLLAAGAGRSACPPS